MFILSGGWHTDMLMSSIYPVIHSLLKLLTVPALLLSYTSAWCNDVNSILAEKQAPAGVVFEIVSNEPGLLNQLLPTVKDDIIKLRQRFPGLPVAIVTHGAEQFDLLSENRSKENLSHGLVETLVKTNDVDVHVCGTHASWYDKTVEDFPDYVDVSATGPAQINDYEALGYELIVLP